MLWQPNDSIIDNANLTQYRVWLEKNYGLSFDNYDQLWAWSVENIATFWESLTKYFNIIFHTPYQSIVSPDPMPHTRWFEGATLNYTEHVFRNKTTLSPAIIYQAEGEFVVEISWETLENQVSAAAHWLKNEGVGMGDSVVAYLPNVPEATVWMLATIALGAVWSSASPDFGAESVIERFQQIEPKVLIASTSYRYNGKTHDKTAVVAEIKTQIPSIQKIVLIDSPQNTIESSIFFSDILAVHNDSHIPYQYVEFSHPIWVLYSSGTTGKPKAITHSQGGILLEHLKYLAFHNDLHQGERFFWFSTTGWMMWNFVQGALLLGGTVVLYNGSPSFPDMNSLWKLVEEIGITHFGTSAPYILSCKKAGISPKNYYNLSSLRSISATGAPLPPEGFAWMNKHISDNLWLVSMSGGTDLCTAFVGGVPTLSVYEGEIQRPCLGAAIDAFDEQGKPLRNEVGEMVITQPMPSMPIYFWNDVNKVKYTESYFEMYPHIWRHGDWLTITDRKTLIISGRSDATLNRNGIRMGTAEIYRIIDQLPEIKDSLIVNVEQKNGEHYMPLFVQMNEGYELNEAIKEKINLALRQAFSPRYVPDAIVVVDDIPYTISGKKLETPVKKILMGMPIEKAANLGAMRNPASLNNWLLLNNKL
jgi:acetoacetyl-CoA synthetase